MPMKKDILESEIVETEDPGTKVSSSPKKIIVEYGGQCPRCFGKMAVYSPQESSICFRCGIIYNWESLPKLWLQVDENRRRKNKSRILGDDE